MERAPGAERAPAQHRSAGELVKQLSEQVPALVRDELKLAQPDGVLLTATGAFIAGYLVFTSRRKR